MSNSISPHYDPFQFYEDPYPTFRRLRREAPLYHNDDLDLWVLSRFEDVQSAVKNRTTFSSAQGVALDDESAFYSPGAFLDYDPPEHDRLRATMSAYFTPRTIIKLESAVRAKVRGTLGPYLEQGEVDFARDVARVVPSSVVCTLLGFPAEDHAQLLAWFELMTTKEAGSSTAPAQAWEANRAMRDYVHAAAVSRARDPQDDMLTVLSHARSEQIITSAELVGMSVLVFYAGIMTTAAFLSNSVKNLDLHRDQRDVLIAEPALIQGAVEELLRFDSPVQSVSRVTTEEVGLHERVIPAGARVLVLYGSANRDESRWHEPDTLNIGREHKQHLAFGVGLHHCLGSSLARLEGRVLIEELLRLMPDYETSGEGKRLFAPHERGFETLPIAFRPTSLDRCPASADLPSGAAQHPESGR